MSPQPKPAKRAPRPRTPIPRGAAPKRKARPSPVRKGETAAIRRKAAALWSRIVRERAGGRCEAPELWFYWKSTWERCGLKATDAAHVLAKSVHPSVRYSLSCGIALCRMHHEEYGSARLVGESQMRSVYKALRGAGAWDSLLTAASLPGPRPEAALAELEKVAQRGAQEAERAS